MQEFIDLGFKAIIVCVNNQYLHKSFAGRIIDNDFIKDLPANVDVCGENGEYHSFVYDGPIFNTPIPFTIGETIYRTYQSPSDTDQQNICSSADISPFSAGFWYTDLLPK
jgi:diphthamide synthase (EF-2-diphthine--ammonia ligase)